MNDVSEERSRREEGAALGGASSGLHGTNKGRDSPFDDVARIPHHAAMNAVWTRREVLAAAAVVLAQPPAAGARAGALDQLLARRRMVRRFKPEPVSEAVVQRLLNAATRAPSAGHTEPWAFVVVRNAERRGALGRAALNQTWLASAPVVIVACADLSRSRPRYGERGNRYGLIDASFASLLLLLAVVEEGLGACFVGAFDDAEVSKLLALPAHVQPLAIIPVGYPAERPRALKRRRLGEIVHNERWEGPGRPQ